MKRRCVIGYQKRTKQNLRTKELFALNSNHHLSCVHFFNTLRSLPSHQKQGVFFLFKEYTVCRANEGVVQLNQKVRRDFLKTLR